VLGGISQLPPEIDGDSLFGTAVVWSDAQNNNAVTFAYSGSSPPYSRLALNPDWRSFDTPAVAVATDWEAIFVAFTDPNGFVQLATSDDGWAGIQAISQGSVNAGPALAYADNTLYIAWQTSSSNLGFATCDQNGGLNIIINGISITSRPTLCVDDPSRIYVLCGGSQSGPGPIKIYLSEDGGNTFNQVTTPPITSVGPPSLAIADQFYLTWADGQTSQLRLAQTADLGAFTPMDYNVGCLGGGPAIIPMVSIGDPNDAQTWSFTLSSGWTTSSTDSNDHHVTVGSFGPIAVGRALAEKRRHKLARLKALGAPNQCPDPLTVYNPATGKCVPRGGCLGGCVLTSYTGTFFGPIFNPIAYAYCVIKCATSR
jgi:hypothetical protein